MFYLFDMYVAMPTAELSSYIRKLDCIGMTLYASLSCNSMSLLSATVSDTSVPYPHAAGIEPTVTEAPSDASPSRPSCNPGIAAIFYIFVSLVWFPRVFWSIDCFL